MSIPTEQKPALQTLPTKPKSGGKSAVLLTTIGAWAFFALAFVGAWVGDQIGGDPAGRGMLSGLLALGCIGVSVLLGLSSLVFTVVFWKRIGWRIRILPFLPLLIFTPFVCLNVFAKPTTDLVIVYSGSQSEIVVDFTGHRVDVGNHTLRQNVPELVSSGQDMRRVHVQWGESYDSKPNDKRFDLRDKVPSFGKDQTIIVTLGDKEATCETRAGRYTASPH